MCPRSYGAGYIGYAVRPSPSPPLPIFPSSRLCIAVPHHRSLQVPRIIAVRLSSPLLHRSRQSLLAFIRRLSDLDGMSARETPETIPHSPSSLFSSDTPPAQGGDSITLPAPATGLTNGSATARQLLSTYRCFVAPADPNDPSSRQRQLRVMKTLQVSFIHGAQFDCTETT